jgi:hypothetical protein
MLAGRADQALTFIVPAVFVCLALILVLCVPAYLLLQRFWKVRLIECVIAGALVAVILNVGLYVASWVALSGVTFSAGDSGGATYVDGQLTAHGWVVAAKGVLFNVVLGASIGACFWILALWRAPRNGGRATSADDQRIKGLL